MERVDWVGFSVLAWMRAGGEGSGSESVGKGVLLDVCFAERRERERRRGWGDLLHEDASVVWDVAFCEF